MTKTVVPTTALKPWMATEMRWKKNWGSLSSPLISEIRRSKWYRKVVADSLIGPSVSTEIGCKSYDYCYRFLYNRTARTRNRACCKQLRLLRCSTDHRLFPSHRRKTAQAFLLVDPDLRSVALQLHTQSGRVLRLPSHLIGVENFPNEEFPLTKQRQLLPGGGAPRIGGYSDHLIDAADGNASIDRKHFNNLLNDISHCYVHCTLTNPQTEVWYATHNITTLPLDRKSKWNLQSVTGKCTPIHCYTFMDVDSCTSSRHTTLGNSEL